MRFLITASLLGSWDWYLKSDPDYETQAWEDFLSCLRKEYKSPTKAMSDGIQFETDVCNHCEDKPVSGDDSYLDTVEETARMVKGGSWQVTGSKKVTISGVDFLLYGRLDVLRGPWIYDIKFGSRFEQGKYSDSPQLRMYHALYPETVGMRFLYADPPNVYIDEYRSRDIGDIEHDVRDFYLFLSRHSELLKVYQEKWKALED